jgi:hypothetical protein
MSYLENGSTLRSLFRLMPPTAHDADPTRSQVLAHIMENMRCDIGRAIRAFNSMRNIKTQVLLFDRVHRQWRGCDWTPPSDNDKISMVMASIMEMRRDISAIRSELRKQKSVIISIKRRRGGSKVDDELEGETEFDRELIEEAKKASAAKQEADAKESEEWFRAMRAALDDADRVSSPSVPLQ